MTENVNLFEHALFCLKISNPKDKVAATELLQNDWLKSKLRNAPLLDVKTLLVPGRPDQPKLVDPKKVPRRNFSSLKGRLTLVHAIAHIEFNAINLALDAVYRFQNMPEQYYTDW